MLRKKAMDISAGASASIQAFAALRSTLKQSRSPSWTHFRVPYAFGKGKLKILQILIPTTDGINLRAVMIIK